MTLKQPALAPLFAGAEKRTLAYSSFLHPQRLRLTTPGSTDYLARLDRTQIAVQSRIRSAIPQAAFRWRYGVTLNGFSVVVSRNRLGALANVPGVETVWPTRTYHSNLDVTPQLIGATTVWGPTLATAGQGMKIAVIDDGIDQTHPFFAQRSLAYPPGFPKGQTAFTTPKVIVARAFPPPSPRYANSTRPFDPTLSDHAIHVAGIAAGDDNTITRNGFHLNGIAPRAYLGNYKALAVPSQFGLNGNSPELAAAIEAAVRDGMDVINMSLGEVEIEPSRDVVVRALNAAADAGVVSAVSAGNDGGEFGLGSVGSPASAAKAIAVAASTGGHGSTETDALADYSSIGPTPYSLRLKPDVTAPGSDVASAFPHGAYGELSGTSMAAPHVAGAAALLMERHPTWTPAQVKSALVLTGDPVHIGSTEVSPLFEGGGRIDVVRADKPLIFASPTNASFGLVRAGRSASRTIALTDAGGGAGTWSVQVTASGLVSAPAQITVPGRLTLRARVAATAKSADIAGFVVLTRGTDRRRIPYWVGTERPLLARDLHRILARPGTYSGNTARGVSRVTSYRYPEAPNAGIPTRLAGREVVYRVRVRRPANFGVAITSLDRGVRVEPRIVRAGDENRLAGYTALPIDLNPYRVTVGKHRLVAGVLLPAPGAYDIVFDTPRNARPGGFTFRYWVGDVARPSLRFLGVRGGAVEFAAGDSGSGIDPVSIEARVDRALTPASYANGRIRVSLALASRGRHTLTLSVGDYQETKNTEDIAGVLPNTRTVTQAFNSP